MPLRAALLLTLAFASRVLAQTFDVVSIKPHVPEPRPVVPFNEAPRPDGSVTMTNVPVRLIIARAYGVGEVVNLPGWATSERYDVTATASLPGVATAAQRASMMKTMLADRFKMVLHVEPREQANFDLVLARKDGALGPGVTRIATDCDRVIAERTAAQAAAPQSGLPQMPDFKTPPPPCSLRGIAAISRDRSGDGQGALGDLLEGEATMAGFASALRLSTGRLVVDKTGLSGSYRLRMNYDQMSALRGPDVQAPDNAGPSVFVALPEQLGLKLEPSKTMVDTVVIDHLERPSEN